MKIRAGYEISYDCPQPTPMILQLNVHPSREHDLVGLDRIHLDPPLPMTTYRDGFDNLCHVIRAPQGRITKLRIRLAVDRNAVKIAGASLLLSSREIAYVHFTL
jgi:hypothetical protein